MTTIITGDRYRPGCVSSLSGRCLVRGATQGIELMKEDHRRDGHSRDICVHECVCVFVCVLA
ncbi:hypothetical protein BP00DRAFT_13534 [Aspergillus indologenus CBS 114.80]|uniref:Uncharacterized protein n=1 Tax=Aspergillus indologenus CBS 114.80 TaxID=1450541 RepID=A0A2V5HTC3_9EURO|nr:hypothetical protein BP00DRAFT_13534 [Aspergillus indologenus CBS 114.80]